MTSNEACFLILSSLYIKKPSNILILEMGKPIKIIDIINKLITLKKKYDPNFETRIIETKLKKGEKLHESLSINRLIKTNVKGINTANEPIYSSKKLYDLIIDLENELNGNKIKIILKKFLKSEIKHSKRH
jgi:FlaA1/EpsC-like NDP-sugar epimerase